LKIFLNSIHVAPGFAGCYIDNSIKIGKSMGLLLFKH
jgi:hypothetical protein